MHMPFVAVGMVRVTMAVIVIVSATACLFRMIVRVVMAAVFVIVVMIAGAVFVFVIMAVIMPTVAVIMVVAVIMTAFAMLVGMVVAAILVVVIMVIMRVTVIVAFAAHVFRADGQQIEKAQYGQANAGDQDHGPEDAFWRQVAGQTTAGVEVKQHAAPKEEHGDTEEMDEGACSTHGVTGVGFSGSL
jgi:hypothetical protein